MDNTIRIKRSVIETIIGASKNVYPREFISLLRKNKKGDIATLLLIPNSTFGMTFSSIRDDMLPMDLDYCGSVHSHPSSNPRPSRADVNFFGRRGSIHIIIAYPFTEENVYVYDKNGNLQEYEIVK